MDEYNWDFTNKNNYAIVFNLMLVKRGVRPATFLMEWDIKRKDIEKKFPKTFKFLYIRKYKSWIISLKELPKPPTSKEFYPGVSNLDMYLGEVLDYTCPGQWIKRIKYSSITYYINDVPFMGEICFKSKEIKSKFKKFDKVAKEMGWKLSEEIKLDSPLKLGLVNRFSKIFVGELRAKMRDILEGKIEKFEWNDKKDLRRIKKEVPGFVIVEGNLVKINKTNSLY